MILLSWLMWSFTDTKYKSECTNHQRQRSRSWTPRPRPRPRPSHIIPRPWPRLRLSKRNILPTSWTPVLGLKKQWLAVTAQELAIWVDCVIVPYLYNELCHCIHINTARIVNTVQWQLPLSQNISHFTFFTVIIQSHQSRRTTSGVCSIHSGEIKGCEPRILVLVFDNKIFNHNYNHYNNYNHWNINKDHEMRKNEKNFYFSLVAGGSCPTLACSWYFFTQSLIIIVNKQTLKIEIAFPQDPVMLCLIVGPWHMGHVGM